MAIARLFEYVLCHGVSCVRNKFVFGRFQFSLYRMHIHVHNENARAHAQSRPILVFSDRDVRPFSSLFHYSLSSERVHLRHTAHDTSQRRSNREHIRASWFTSHAQVISERGRDKLVHLNVAHVELLVPIDEKHTRLQLYAISVGRVGARHVLPLAGQWWRQC